LTANAQTTTAFDYYVSPTGNDANPGTLAQPWAITSLSLSTWNSNNVANCLKQAGKRIGFLPGTYNVSAYMYNDPVSGALQIIGGTASASTYWGSSDANGNYSPRTATITALSPGGVYGGFHATGPGVYDGPAISHTGLYPRSYATGYAILDGLRVTGCSYKAIRFGGGSSSDGPLIAAPVVIRNCEVFGCGYNTGDYIDNMNGIWVDGCTNALVSNNYVHDNLGHSGASNSDHLNGIFCPGFSPGTSGSVFQYNTVINAGNIYGKENFNQGNTIQYNYVDVSMYGTDSNGIQDWTGANASGLTQTTIIRNNIIVMAGGVAGGGVGIGHSTLSDSYAWTTPVQVYNNTIIVTGSNGPVYWWGTEGHGGNGIQQMQWYNNICAGGTSSGSFNGLGNFMTNPEGPQIWDYNLVPSNASWGLYSNGSTFGTVPTNKIASYSSPAAFAAGLAANGGIGNAEANSVQGTPTFVGGAGGALANKYKLASGSLGVGQGSTTGKPGGAACDMGAWGGANAPTQIGCSFAGGGTSSNAVPNPPALTVS
jgi:hypothetical protein